MRVAMTEYLKIDLNTERWTCHLRWCAHAAALAWAQGAAPGVAASVGFAPPAPAGTLRLLTGNDFWAGAEARTTPNSCLRSCLRRRTPKLLWHTSGP